jgi:SAM-dependent methyltransferase
MFGDNAFDIVWHAFSMNFVPSVEPVFDEVARVLRPGGLYRMQCGNPFFADMDERQWNGEGYTISRPYGGGEISFKELHWDVADSQGTTRQIEGPREFSHTLNDITTGLARRGFFLHGIWEEPTAPANPESGSWEHMLAIAPPWLTFWATYRPDIL